MIYASYKLPTGRWRAVAEFESIKEASDVIPHDAQLIISDDPRLVDFVTTGTVSVDKASRMMGVHPGTVRKLVQTGELKYYVGKTILKGDVLNVEVRTPGRPKK